jgi:hypothetical protein
MTQEETKKSNVLYVLGREFILRDEFTLLINADGAVETVGPQHLFENEVMALKTLKQTYLLVQAEAQLVAHRAQGRGIPLDLFVVRVKQHFVQDDTKAPIDWSFEFTLCVGEEENDKTTSDDRTGPATEGQNGPQSGGL